MSHDHVKIAVVDATAATAEAIESQIEPLGGRIDGTTPGLVSCTIPITAGFPAIEIVFEKIIEEKPGAQWQFANVYDPVSGEPLLWWDQSEV